MFRKLVYLISFVQMLGPVALTSSASGALVAHWPFNNSPNDQVGTLNRTLNGGATYSTDSKEGSASLLCDGVDDYANVGGAGLMSATFSTKTVMLWFKANKTEGTQVIYDEGGANNGLAIHIYEGALEAAVAANGARSTLSTPISSAKWWHVAVSFDNGAFNLYLNGRQAGSATATFTSVPSHTDPSGIGARSGQDSFGDKGVGGYYGGLIDDVRMYDNVPTLAEIQVISGYMTEAMNVSPANGATDVPLEPVLGWKPGEFAKTHDVYFGTTFADVNTASRTSQKGVLASQGQDANTYDPAGLLSLGQTYYWRIDEVNAPPDSTIYKGNIWTFTAEPIALAIKPIAATASSSQNTDSVPGKTIDGSGVNASDQHSVLDTTMWLSNIAGPQPTWIQYDFDKVYKLHQMWVWNSNQSLEAIFGLGTKDVTVEYSTDPNTSWTPLAGVSQFARATGTADYVHNTTVDFGGVAARYVKITIKSNWGGLLPQYGLSEVRFFQIPVRARLPQPTSAATNVALGATLSWRPGRDAARHDLYFGTDPNAVRDATTPTKTVTQASCALSSLSPEYGNTYYWKVNEVNDAATPTTWSGDVWSFSTPQYGIVDDFESYTNDSPKRVFQTWIDGAGFSPDEFFPQGNKGNGSGSLIGYDPTLRPIMETKAVHSGRQSMPLAYDNTSATYSEATRTFDSQQNWALHGIKGLTLWFYGDPNNVPQQMYVKLNNTKIPYDGDAMNLKLAGWKMWYIDLTSRSVSSVATLSIGFDRLGGAGGQGKVFIDDIRLYSYGRELITPVAPDASGLQAQYQFEGNTNDSVGTRHLTVTGAPQYAAGKAGQAILLNGTSDFATVESSFDLPVYSAAMWFRVDGGTGQRDILSIYDSAGGFGISAEIGSDGTFRFLHRFPFGSSGGTNIYSTFSCADGTWYHAAIVKSPDTMTLYLNGMPAGSATNTTQFDKALARLTIGVLKHDNLQRYFLGAIDDVRLYNRVLSAAEIAALAGVTVPFDKPF